VCRKSRLRSRLALAGLRRKQRKVLVMRDYIALGTSPIDEACAYVGEDDYWEKAKKEGRVFQKQLERVFGPPPETAYFAGKSFSHDFGTYVELCIFYDMDSKEEVEYALKLEDEMPEYWDEKAREELGLPVQERR